MNDTILLLTVVFTAITCISGIIAVFVKNKIDIARLQTEVEILKTEKKENDNKFSKLFDKIEELKDLIISKL